MYSDFLVQWFSYYQLVCGRPYLTNLHCGSVIQKLQSTVVVIGILQNMQSIPIYCYLLAQGAAMAEENIAVSSRTPTNFILLPALITACAVPGGGLLLH